MRTTLRALLAITLLAPALLAQPNWTQLSPATSPPGRSSGAMAYDTARDRAVLFGGTNGFTNLGDTWEWNGSNWIQASPAASPPPRIDTAMAYDQARGNTLLFGGGSRTTTFGDTWVWNGANWTQLFPVTSPSPRAAHAMAYDARRGKVVLFGGTGANGAETWEWDGVTWTLRTHSPPRPPANNAHTMAYDAGRGRVVVTGGWVGPGVWEWDGTQWFRATPTPAPPALTFTRIAYDTLRARTVLFGGGRQPNPLVRDTWEWNGTTWTQILTANTPSARNHQAMVYDVVRGKVLMFGGYANAYIADTWEYGTSLQIVATGTPRLGSRMTMTLKAPSDPGRNYHCASSLATGPTGIDVRQVNLAVDSLLAASVSGTLPGVFGGYAGALSANGRATSTLAIPNITAVTGVVIHNAFVVLDPAARSGIRSISPTYSFQIQ